MGRRKTQRKVAVTKAPEKVPRQFTCPFCSGEDSVSSILDREKGVGTVSCDACGSQYTTNISALDEPVDVYCEWIDACEEAN